MTNISREITQDTLHAYVDGELHPHEHVEVSRAISTDAAALSEVEHYRFQRDALKALYDRRLAEQSPERFRNILYGKSPEASAAPPPRPANDAGIWRRPWIRQAGLAAAIVLLAGVSSVGGWVGHDRYAQTATAQAQIESFLNQAYSAYSLYANDLSGEAISDERLTTILATLSERLGAEINPPRTGDNFRLVDTQIIPVGGGIGAIFHYRDLEDRKISLYIQPNWNDTQKLHNVFERDEVAFQYNVEGMLAYALAAPSGMEGLPGLDAWLGKSD